MGDNEDDDDCACEVDRFTVATISKPDVYVDSTTGLTNVRRNAWFVAYFRHNGCCDCCQFRQYVRGYVEVDGVALAPAVPGFNFLFFREDQNAAGERYGHRTDPDKVWDRYVPTRGAGCIYVGWDTPGIRNLHSGQSYFIYYEFVDVIIDTCGDVDEVVAGPETWDMIAVGTVP